MAPAKTAKVSPTKSTNTAPSTSSNSTATTKEPLSVQIARRAYERWCERGCPHGTDQQDWYDAECEILGTKNNGQRK